MIKPALLVLAAGMGSRYGGSKQTEPINERGEFLIDYSVRYAREAGFARIIFIIREEHRQLFRETIDSRIKGVEYVYQSLYDLPNGFALPEHRVKPWGTAHAMRSARGVVKEPFAVINADDYYGREGFVLLYNFLTDPKNNGKAAMVGYILSNTLTDNGSVSRGVCVIDEHGKLITVTERKRIEKRSAGGSYTEDGKNWIEIPPGSVASMNFWGFMPEMFDLADEGFSNFLKTMEDPLKSEYLLPHMAQEFISGSGELLVLPTSELWYGITYPEDKPLVIAALKKIDG